MPSESHPRSFNFPEQKKPEQKKEELTGLTGAAKQAASSVAESAQEAWDSTKHQAEHLADNAKEAWDSTRQQVKRAANEVTNVAENALDSTTEFVRRYPVVAICAGFGFGLLLGMTLPLGASMTRQMARYSS